MSEMKRQKISDEPEQAKYCTKKLENITPPDGIVSGSTP